MKEEIMDMTFLIPVRIDSMIRLENLQLTIDFLKSNFYCHIFLLESDRYNRHLLDRLCTDIKYEFVEDKDVIFYRTKYLNQMTLQSNTDYLAIWDADIIIPTGQIVDSIQQLRGDKYQVAYPYNGCFMETSDILRAQYFENRDIGFLSRNVEKMRLLNDCHENVGGAVLVNRKAYIMSGMENEHFYGWGAEDNERFFRWKSLDYSIYRSEGVLFPLTHPRGENSGYTSKFHQEKAYAELSKTVAETDEEILHNINNNYYRIS